MRKSGGSSGCGEGNSGSLGEGEGGGGARSTISKKILLFKQEKVTIEDTILG